MSPSLSALLLFPSLAHHRVYVGPYGHVVDAPEVQVDALPLTALRGLDMGWRHFEVEPSQDDDGWSLEGAEFPAHLRLHLEPDGTVAIDQLSLGYKVIGLSVRRPLGDLLDLSILGGRWEATVAATDTGRFQLRAIVPSELTLLGFSNTDFDADSRLKAYISAGGGLGGDAIGRILGPLGFYVRLVGAARTFNRHQGDLPNQVRHELHAEGEAGLALLGERHAIWLSGWGELTSQHETRDAGGKDGPDRQYVAWGLRLSGRFPELGSNLDAPLEEASPKATTISGPVPQ